MKVQARRANGMPRHSVLVLYRDDWETCEGSEGLTMEEAQLVVRDWQRDDRRTMRELHQGRSQKIHDYQIVAE